MTKSNTMVNSNYQTIAPKALRLKQTHPITADKTSTNAADFSSLNDDVFERIAKRYDFICDLFSFGLHRLWKRRLINTINQEPWHNLLDVASGTGTFVYQLLHQNALIEPISQTNKRSQNTPQNDKPMLPQLIVSDMSTEMLKSAKTKLANYEHCIQFMPLDAHNMADIASNSQEVVSISLGLKVLDRNQAFKEALRVLKPHGRLITLEASTIGINWLHRLYLKAMCLTIPLLARFAAKGDTSTYYYFLKGIKAFPNATVLAQEMREVGFKAVTFERLSMGVVAIHTARKG